MVNRERGEIEIKAVDGQAGGPWTFRLDLTATARLQQELGIENLPEFFGILGSMADGSGNFQLRHLLCVLLCGLQEFHGDTIRTTYDVEPIVKAAGGLVGVMKQVSPGINDALTPDPEDQKRREANPRKARAKRTH